MMSARTNAPTPTSDQQHHTPAEQRVRQAGLHRARHDQHDRMIHQLHGAHGQDTQAIAAPIAVPHAVTTTDGGGTQLVQ